MCVAYGDRYGSASGCLASHSWDTPMHHTNTLQTRTVGQNHTCVRYPWQGCHKCAVVYGVFIRLWPTLQMSNRVMPIASKIPWQKTIFVRSISLSFTQCVDLDQAKAEACQEAASITQTSQALQQQLDQVGSIAHLCSARCYSLKYLSYPLIWL